MRRRAGEPCKFAVSCQSPGPSLLTQCQRRKMTKMKRYCHCSALCLALLGVTVAANDHDTYNRRSTERFVAPFEATDINHDDVVFREEATTTIELVARFDDIDVDRDGIMRIALTRYIDANFR